MTVKRLNLIFYDYYIRLLWIVTFVFFFVTLLILTNEGITIAFYVFLGSTVIFGFFTVSRIKKVTFFIQQNINNQIEANVIKVIRSGRVIWVTISYKIGEKTYEKRILYPKTKRIMDLKPNQKLTIVYNATDIQKVYIVDFVN